MTMLKTYRNATTFCTVFLTLVLASAAYAGPLKSGQSVDAQLGLRFTTPLPANVPQGMQVEGIVTSPEKLAAFGLGSVKKGDKVLLIAGPSDSFSVKLGGQSLALMVSAQGIIVHRGAQAAPAAMAAPRNAPPPNAIILQNKPDAPGAAKIQGGVK